MSPFTRTRLLAIRFALLLFAAGVATGITLARRAAAARALEFSENGKHDRGLQLYYLAAERIKDPTLVNPTR